MSEAKSDHNAPRTPEELSVTTPPAPGEVAPPAPEAPAIKPKPAPDEDAPRPTHPLWAAVERLLDEVVPLALRRYFPEHEAEDVGRFKQMLKLLLWADEQKLVGNVQDATKLKPWLQRVANHKVIRILKEERRKVSFDDAPPEVLIQPSTQEEELLQKEQEQLLDEALAKLTPRERKLVELIQQGLKAEEIAQELGIKAKSVHRMKNAAVKKLGKLVNGGWRK